MDHALKYIVVIALAFPLVLYFRFATRTPRSKVSTLAGYFAAYHQVGAAPFANSSLAYAFQVATLFPFLYWGVMGQIVPALVNAICWGIGIFLFRKFLPPIIRCLNDAEGPRTLHGLLGAAYDEYPSKAVQHVAAGVTILGMLGVAIAEAYWGMQIVKVIVPEDTPAYYAVVLGALFFVLIYIWYGGTWGSIKTDMLQLVFSYIGFTVVFIFAICKIFEVGATLRPEFAIVSIVMIVGGVLAISIRLRNGLKPVSSMDGDDKDIIWLRLAQKLSVFTFISMAVLVVCFSVLFFRSFSALNFTPLTIPGDPKWHGVIALAVMATIFQFVDMTAWQRIQSIAGSNEGIKKRTRSGLLLYMCESPYSWVMCLALGTLLVATTPELATVTDKGGVLAAYPKMLIESGGPFQLLVALAFMAAVMGVMLSTIDSALLAAMYAWVADIHGTQFKKPELVQEDDDLIREKSALLSGKTVAFWVLIVIVSLVIVLGGVLKRPDQFIGVLVGFYGAMLSLFPAVIVMLLLKKSVKLSGKAVAIGIYAGVCASIVCVVWGLFVPDRSWDGVFAGPGVAAVTPIILYGIGMRRQ
jgi:Na+/proline symporter